MSTTDHHFVVCVANGEYKASLEVRKIYERLPDERALAKGFVRVIDESGEDYLYPQAFFVDIELPASLEEKLLLAS